MAINVSRNAVYEAADKLSNWGRWGGDDQVGTLNYIKPEDIVRAASLVRQGKTEDEVLAAKPTADYDSIVPNSSTTSERFVRQLYAELKTN